MKPSTFHSWIINPYLNYVEYCLLLYQQWLRGYSIELMLIFSSVRLYFKKKKKGILASSKMVVTQNLKVFKNLLTCSSPLIQLNGNNCFYRINFLHGKFLCGLTHPFLVSDTPHSHIQFHISPLFNSVYILAFGSTQSLWADILFVFLFVYLFPSKRTDTETYRLSTVF